MKYTVEEVRETERILRKHSNGPGTFDYEASDMLTAYAARIERAQAGVTDDIVERAVDARIKRLCEAGSANNVSDNELMRSALLAVWPSPPAQAAQGDDAITEYYEDRNRARSQGGFTHPRDVQTAPTPEPVAQPADSGRVPDGLVLVPREPTKAMLDAAMAREDDEPLTDWGKIIPASHAEIYKAMLAAAPQPGESA